MDKRFRTNVLRKTVEHCDEQYGPDVKEFIDKNFNVDDGLISMPTAAKVIDIVRRAQSALNAEGKIRLHKITSNSTEVMQAFPQDDRGAELKSLEFGEDFLPVQRSLGLAWDLHTDSFLFNIPDFDKPFTRRGLLSTVNSIFDPIVFFAPFTVIGKILLREATPTGADWDDPLPPSQQEAWNQWRSSLISLRDLRIPRMFLSLSLSSTNDIEIHIFSDASEKAIAAAAYLDVKDQEGVPHFGFIIGKSKLAPSRGHTIPRLELCGAVLAVELWDLISDHMEVTPAAVKFYTDSKVALGYITNQTRRFYTYVSNRVERIRSRTVPQQWNYVPTHLNPADSATRCSFSDVDSRLNVWINASQAVQELCRRGKPASEEFPLVNPEDDKEIRLETVVQNTSVLRTGIGTHRFERFSNWRRLVMTVSLLKHIASNFSKDSSCRGWHHCDSHKSVSAYQEAERFIAKEISLKAFLRRFSVWNKGNHCQKVVHL